MKRSRSRKSPRRQRPAQARPAQARPAAARRPAPAPKKSTFVRDDPVTEPERPAPSYAPRGDSRVADKVVNLNNGGGQLKVVLAAPKQFEAAGEIADHLRDRRAVLINLEKTDPAVARRLIDFLSGVAYAQDGKIRRVASATYIITPFNVDLMGDQLDDMESGEFHL
ncbi:MAG: cell division protein SepF [Oscillospiraceae bacterium]